MQKATAISLIQRHRGRTQAEESDAGVARRAARKYLGGGLIFMAIALLVLFESVASRGLPLHRICFIVILLVGGSLFCWQSYRLALAGRILKGTKSGAP